MKITIAGGAGAMGSIFGGRLFQKGHDVILYDVSDNAVQKINEDGLRIIDKNDKTEVINVKASTDPSKAENSDVIIIFTKCFGSINCPIEMPAAESIPEMGLDNKGTGITPLPNGG